MANSTYEYEQFLPQGMFYMRDSLLEEKPDIRLFVNDSLVMKDRDRFYEYKNNNLIDITINGNTSKVSLDLVYDVLTNEGMFKYLITSLDKDYGTAVSIVLYSDDSIVDIIKISKAELVMALRQLDASKINANISIRMVLVYSLTNQNVFLNYYDDDEYSCVIDNEEYTIKYTDIIRILTSNKNEYRSFLNDTRELPYDNRTVAYMIVDFCEKESIFDKYVFDDVVYERYLDLKSYRTIDFESINKNKKSDDQLADGTSMLDEFVINSDLYHSVVDDIDLKYDALEQSIYIYIRLCDLLTYDDEQFLANNQFEKTGVHSDISNISNISLENNKVVSFEFMLLYAKFLRELGIKYSLNLNSIAGYVEEKSSIKFKHGEYLVVVDLFKNIIKNDMTMVKVGGTLSSIRSYNTNETTHKKLEEKIYSIYTNYRDSLKRREEFLKDVRQYKIDYYKSKATKKDKLYMLFKLIGRKDLKGIDSINYINEVLSRVIGNDDSISFVIYASKDGEHSKPVVIINYNNGEDNIYYMINVHLTNSVSICSEEYIDSLIESNVLVPIYNKNNINVKEGPKHVK